MFAIDDAFNGIEGLPATGNEAVPLIYLKIAKEEKKQTEQAQDAYYFHTFDSVSVS